MAVEAISGHSMAIHGRELPLMALKRLSIAISFPLIAIYSHLASTGYQLVTNTKTDQQV